MIQINPSSTEINLEDLAVQIKAIKYNGLEWGVEVKREPLAYGLEALLVSCIYYANYFYSSAFFLSPSPSLARSEP